MLQHFLVLCFLLQLLPLLVPKNPECKKSNDKENRYQKAGRKTYEHFMKAINDEEMRRFLIANYQNPKDYEGLSRITICEKMKQKAILTGEEYTRYPF